MHEKLSACSGSGTNFEILELWDLRTLMMSWLTSCPRAPLVSETILCLFKPITDSKKSHTKSHGQAYY